jgi:hypothetical protein
VCYVARTLDTAVAETRHHRERFMRATDEPPMELDMRVYLMTLDRRLHDIRRLAARFRAVYRPDDYHAAQVFGRRLRDAGSWGIAYDSVRHTGGECAGVFRPKALSNCRQERHLCYVWDGARITRMYRKSAMGPTG